MFSGSTSGISEMKVLATDVRASSGHSLNQSMVQHVTREGNCRKRARNTSPIGLKKQEIISATFYFEYLLIIEKSENRFLGLVELPKNLSFNRQFMNTVVSQTLELLNRSSFFPQSLLNYFKLNFSPKSSLIQFSSTTPLVKTL